MSTPLKRNLSRSVFASLAALSGVLVCGPSQAVSLSQNGEGQVLIYPYYTVRGGNDSYLSVLNSTDQAKVLIVRLRESRNGREVQALRLFLAARDQWTAGITATAEGAKLFSNDQSCTTPAIPAAGVPLSNARFNSTTLTPGLVSSGGDGAGTELDRTREGYIEIIELGVITDAALLANLSPSPSPVGGGASCPQPLLDADRGPQAGDRALGAPSGGLSGSGTLINVLSGTQYSYQPVVLEAFANVNLWSVEGPDLRAATPKVSLVLGKGRAITSTWFRGEDAVSAVLMRASLINEYVMEPTTLSSTDWVVTMPTKHFYVPVAKALEDSTQVLRSPFGVAFREEWGACDRMLSDDRMFTPDREGHFEGGVLVGVEPLYASILCGEASVLSFGGNTQILKPASPFPSREAVAPTNWNGWAEHLFDEPYQRLTSREGHVYHGLPAIGFMVHDFVNGDVNGLLSNYGGNFDHKYTTIIETN
ncbi:MAG: hypothetical protein V4812_15880 [Pseudomonadota bacterium]